jgi:predicted acetyltransferase
LTERIEVAEGFVSMGSTVSEASNTPGRPRPDEERPGQAVANDGALRLLPAVAGDHPAVQQFLAAVFQYPSRDAFLASLDDPFYEPADRLLLKAGQQVVAHAQVTKRVMSFGELRLPAAGLIGLGTSPEVRGHGYGRGLLQAAEEQMVRDGAVLGFLRTRIPHFFRPAGWAVCGRHVHSRAGSRDVLAQLSAQSRPDVPPLKIRPWRQVELPALMRLYAGRFATSYGPLERTEAYWRWLISRKSFDQIFVAIEGPDRMDLDDTASPIVGYVITKDDQILELVTANHRQAAEQLLGRACGEAIERDFNAVCCHAPPDDPLHRLLQVAGGTLHHHEVWQGEAFMVRLFDPPGFLRLLCPQLHARAAAGRLPRRLELGLATGDSKYLLVLSRRSVKLVRGKMGRSYLRLNDADFTRLLLGHLDLSEAVEAGRVEPSTRIALETARVLFPRLPLWRPPLDDLAE